MSFWRRTWDTAPVVWWWQKTKLNKKQKTWRPNIRVLSIRLQAWECTRVPHYMVVHSLTMYLMYNIAHFQPVLKYQQGRINILDKIIITNCSIFYSTVLVMSPFGMSDCSCVFYLISNQFLFTILRKIRKCIMIIRPLPDGGLRSFRKWITHAPFIQFSVVA